MEYSWISVPASTHLEDKSRWVPLGNNIFAGLRHLLLVVEQNAVIKIGPLIDQVDWPVNSKYSHQHRKKNVIKYTAGINESITSAVTQQLSTEVISKVNSNLNTGKILLIKLFAELQEKKNTQLTETLYQGLSQTKTFETQEENEVTQTLEFIVPKGVKGGDTRTVNIFNKVKEIRWDVFLYQSDYLQLEYNKNWIWKDVRKTIQTDSASLKKPLFSIIFYEPIPSPSYGFDEFEPEVQTLSEINTQELLTVCPTRTLPNLMSLEKLAKLSFPATKEEKKDVKKREEAKRITIVRSGLNRRFVKGAAPKMGLKKATLKMAAKNTAFKSVTSKGATKNAAPKRASRN